MIEHIDKVDFKLDNYPCWVYTIRVTDSPDMDRSESTLLSPHKVNLNESINSIFPTLQEENSLQKTRRILAESANDIQDEDLQAFITELQYLINSWFDYYEKQVFGGQTLRQILREG